ncbi:MAG: hypothetical protein ACREKN_02615 [Longimicrobiaceae bacterium]
MAMVKQNGSWSREPPEVIACALPGPARRVGWEAGSVYLYRMGKLLILLLVAAVFAIANPSVRDWLRPHVQPLIDPINQWSVEKKVSEFARFLNAEAMGGRVIRDDATFHRVLQSEYPGVDEEMDPWGNPYFLARSGAAMRVASPGRDGEPGTADDIFSEPLDYPARDRR